MSLHQKLMDDAYNSWGDNASYETFVDSLDEKHQLAVLTGNLNYQVENGGFVQWDINEYISKIDLLIELLKKHNVGKNGKIVIEILEVVKDSKEDLEQIREYDDEYEEEEENYYEVIGMYDTEYYKVGNGFLKEVEEKLKKM